MGSSVGIAHMHMTFDMCIHEIQMEVSMSQYLDFILSNVEFCVCYDLTLWVW